MFYFLMNEKSFLKSTFSTHPCGCLIVVSRGHVKLCVALPTFICGGCSYHCNGVAQFCNVILVKAPAPVVLLQESQVVWAEYWTEPGLRLALGLLLGDIFPHFHRKKPRQRRVWVRQRFVVETLGCHSQRRPKRRAPAFRAAVAWQYFRLHWPVVLEKQGCFSPAVWWLTPSGFIFQVYILLFQCSSIFLICRWAAFVRF